MEIITEFTKRFNECIAESGKSHAEIAELLHINVHDIIRWASGKNRYLPSVEKLLLFANFFGCTVDFLIGLSEEDKTDFVLIEEPKIAGRFKKIVYEERGFTFAKLSKETWIRNTTLFYNWNSGKAKPQIENLTKVARVLEITVDYLIGRER